jgi:aspartyl-tRNA(Asn)/glutamyl-tRNA(Gln) amidotransferase subunit A
MSKSAFRSPLLAAAKGITAIPAARVEPPVSAVRAALNSTLPKGSPLPPPSTHVSTSQTPLLRHAPLGVKANICTDGHPATAASKALGNYQPPYTATAVSRATQHGGLISSVCNMDEFGMGSASAFSFHGPSYNPYSAPLAVALELTSNGDMTALEGLLSAGLESSWLTPGGSSGGSAAAVASGEVFAAFGSDTGGSVRQPASFCGIVGLKPSYGRLSRWGLIAYASSLDTVGLLTRSVADAALLFDVCAGHDPRDDTSLRLPVAAPTLLDLPGYEALAGESAAGNEAILDLSGLRVGIPAEYLVEELTEDARSNLLKACETLQEAGATVVPIALNSDNAAALSAYYLIASAEASSNLSRYDGVRYGHRAKEDGLDTTSSASGNAAEKLHRLYKRTRTEGFGEEVQRRLMVGNFALSKGARAEYYEAACDVRRLITKDFDRAFRPLAASSSSTTNLPASLAKRQMEEQKLLFANPINRYLAGLSAVGGADAASGVDVLITPTTPSPPWLSSKTKEQRPIDIYSGDIMTIPASLARLPALIAPTSFNGQSYRDEAWQAFEACITKNGAASQSQKGLLERVKSKLALPTSVQLIGRYCDETTLLRVGAVIENKARAISKLPDHIRWLQEAPPGR